MQSSYENGCDDLTDESGAVDICAHCAAVYKFQPALYFCFDCGVFGRCMCGDCNQLHKRFAHKHVVRRVSSPTAHTSRNSDSSKQQEEVNSLKRELEAIKRQYNETISDMRKKDDKAKEIEQQYKLYVKQTEELTKRKDMLEEENKRLTSENSRLQEEIKRLIQALENLKGLKLRDNNPILKDLTDQNRPTKIAEKLSELYDNQWADAFDNLQNDGKDDQTIIKELLDMLMNIFKECSRLANDRYLEKVQDSIDFPVLRKVRDRPLELPYQLKQQVKEFRRVQATKVVREIQEVVFENLGLYNKNNDIKSYLTHCVEIGWLAAVQDPPLALCGKSLDRFDTNMLKDYTQKGPYVEYVVWPALLLHENGPLLAKGVAQGCSVKPVSSLQIPNPTERQNAYATVSRTATKAMVSPRERPAGNVATGTRITKVNTPSSNLLDKERDF